MAPKHDRVYARGWLITVAPFARQVSFDNERELEYVLPGTSNPSRVARAPKATPKKVASSVVTASQSDDVM